MQRYSLDAYLEMDEHGPKCNAVLMNKGDTGEWVRYADAQAEIDRLRAENDRFRKIVIAAIQARDGMMPRAQTCMHIADALDGLTMDDLSTPAAR